MGKFSLGWFLLSCFADVSIMLYIVNTIQAVHLNAKDNIVELWQNLYSKKEPPVQQEKPSFFSLFSSKNEDHVELPLNEYEENMRFLYIYFRTFLIIGAVCNSLYLTCKILFQLYRDTKPAKASNVIPPAVFKKKTNVLQWLDMFELYLAEERITSNRYKCVCLLSHLDIECMAMVKHYGEGVEKEYPRLIEAMKNLFAVDPKTACEAQLEFNRRQQHTNENIHQYYAALMEISTRAFGTYSKQQRLETVGNRFIYGIAPELDNLRYKLLEKYNSNNKKKPIEWNKLIMDAETLRHIYAQKQIHVDKIRVECMCIKRLGITNNKGNIRVRCEQCDPSSARVSKVNTVETIMKNMKCYKCAGIGHFKQQCPLKGLSKNDSEYKRVKAAIKEVTTKYRNSTLDHIRGTCLIDDVKRDFLVDTGSPRTLINARILNVDELNSLRPAGIKVLTANDNEANCTGVKRCKIQHGNFVCYLDVLVTTDIHEDCLIGMDYLRSSDTTKTHIYALNDAILDGSALIEQLSKTEHSLAINKPDDIINVNRISIQENNMQKGRPDYRFTKC